MTLDIKDAFLINTTKPIAVFLDDAGSFSGTFPMNQANYFQWAGGLVYAVRVIQVYDTTFDWVFQELLFMTAVGADYSEGGTQAMVETATPWDANNLTNNSDGMPSGGLLQTIQSTFILNTPYQLPSFQALQPYLDGRGFTVQNQQVNLSHGFAPYSSGSDYWVHIYVWITPTGIPPLRIYQRQDGLGAQGHARHNQIGASNSGSENTGHRLKGSNTYG